MVLPGPEITLAASEKFTVAAPPTVIVADCDADWNPDATADTVMFPAGTWATAYRPVESVTVDREAPTTLTVAPKMAAELVDVTVPLSDPQFWPRVNVGAVTVERRTTVTVVLAEV